MENLKRLKIILRTVFIQISTFLLIFLQICQQLKKIKVQLIYSVVLISGIQQSDSIYIYIVFFIVFSIIGCYKILNVVPCAIHQDLVFYLFCMQQFVFANPKFLIYSFPTSPEFFCFLDFFNVKIPKIIFSNMIIKNSSLTEFFIDALYEVEEMPFLSLWRVFNRKTGLDFDKCFFHIY